MPNTTNTFGPRKRKQLTALVDGRRFNLVNATALICLTCGVKCEDGRDPNTGMTDAGAEFLDWHNVQCLGAESVKTKDVRSRWQSTWHKKDI